MTPEKEKELEALLTRWKTQFEAKFRKGDENHSNDQHTFDQLTVEELLIEAIWENLDQFAYLAKALFKLSR